MIVNNTFHVPSQNPLSLFFHFFHSSLNLSCFDVNFQIIYTFYECQSPLTNWGAIYYYLFIYFIFLFTSHSSVNFLSLAFDLQAIYTLHAYQHFSQTEAQYPFFVLIYLSLLFFFIYSWFIFLIFFLFYCHFLVNFSCQEDKSPIISYNVCR